MSAVSFHIERSSSGHLSAADELNFETAAQALQSGLELLRQEPASVVDLSAITEGDSAGVAVLIEWLADARARDRRLAYQKIPTQMLAIARLSDIDEILLGERGEPGRLPGT